VYQGLDTGENTRIRPGTSIFIVLEIIVKLLLVVAAIAFVHQNFDYQVSTMRLLTANQSLPCHISITRAFSVNGCLL
jgi:hypothetical protein